MKALQLLLLGIVLFLANSASAQVVVNFNPPAWGPAGYTEVRYYYLPDVESYYDVSTRQFIYYGNGTWVHRTSLPARYRSYDLYRGYKVVMTDYHGNSPYVYYPQHKVKYHKGYSGGPQKTVGSGPHQGYHKPHAAPKAHTKSPTKRPAQHSAPAKHGAPGHSGGSHPSKGGKGNSGHGKGHGK